MTRNNNSNPDAQQQKKEKSEKRGTLGTCLGMAAILLSEVVIAIARVVNQPRRQRPGNAEAKAVQASPSGIEAGFATQTEIGAVDPLSPRALDRNLDAEVGVHPERREFWGMLLAACASLVTLAGCIGFLIAYWADVGNFFLGGSLALALGGLGATLVIWGRMLTVQREAIAPREPLRPPEPERKAADEAFTLGAHDIRRRCLLRWIGYSAAGMFAAMAASLLRSLGLPSYSALNSHIWKRGQRLMTIDGRPVTVDSMQPGNTLTVFPEGSIGDERSQTVLVRVDPALLELPKGREDWAPHGILAYSRVCTHAGCTVGLYEKTNYLLLCPCHQSTFNVLRAARPNGGPAARALPQLPIYTDSDGTLRAGGGFSEPPGPGFWGMA